jgi:hypothetical protein
VQVTLDHVDVMGLEELASAVAPCADTFGSGEWIGTDGGVGVGERVTPCLRREDDLLGATAGRGDDDYPC